MLISKILNESAGNVIYHFTSLFNLYHIIKTDTFALTPSLSREEDSKLNKNKLFYASLTRSKIGDYGNNKHVMACLVLDKNKLNQFKIMPVDYYQNKSLTNEMEERLLSDKPYIKNFINYIISVDIFIRPQRLDDLSFLKKIKHLCDSVGIDVRFFKDHTNFNYSKNFLSGDALEDMLADVEDHGEIEPVNNSYDNKSIDPFINLLKGINLDDEDTKKLLYSVKYNRTTNDIRLLLKNVMHNGYKSEAAKELSQVSRRFNLNTLHDIANFIKQKYSNK